METFQLILGFLRAILGVVSDSTVSGHQKNEALAYLDLAGKLVTADDEIDKVLQDLTERVKTGAKIRDEEWALLRNRSDAAHATIQGFQEEDEPEVISHPNPDVEVATVPPKE